MVREDKMTIEFKKESYQNIAPSEASKYQLSEEEIRRIISSALCLRDRLIIELLAFTGCRRGELVLLRRMDINLEKSIILVPTIKRREATPFDNIRKIPIINEGLKRDLEAYIEITELKFHPNPNDKLIRGIQNKEKPGLDVVRINQIVAESAERAGVKSPNPHRKHVHPHMFRHNFVRYARRSGINFKVISQLIGHQSVATTMDLYGTPDEQEIFEESKKMSGYAERK